MTSKQIQRKKISLRKKRDLLLDQLVELQELCQHPNVTKTYKGSTGHYDPSADSYWIDWKCPDCDKFWVTDQ